MFDSENEPESLPQTGQHISLNFNQNTGNNIVSNFEIIDHSEMSEFCYVLWKLKPLEL